jgi:hypothetical protein
LRDSAFIANDLFDVNVETINCKCEYVNKGCKSTVHIIHFYNMDCGAIPVSISYNMSLVILSRMALNNFNVLKVLYVYMCIDETIIKKKIYIYYKMLIQTLLRCRFVFV